MSIIDGDHNPLRIRLRPRPRFSVEDLILARLRGDIPNVTPDERMDDFIGVEEPPDPLEAGPEESALPGPSFLERFGANVQQEPFIAQPEGFGQGLVAGLAGGLQRRGQRSAQRRAEAERAIRERRAERESLNRAATEQYRRDRAAAMRELAKETRGERRDIAKEGRAAARDIAKFEREFPERERREQSSQAAAFRASTAAERQAAAAERQERMSRVQTVNQLATAYRQDKAIESYNDVRSNLNTAIVAAREKSGPGDIAIIFSYMRAIEPGNVNVVREGDVKTARQAIPLLETVKALPPRYFRGNQLTDEGRAHFINFMRSSLQSRRPDFDIATEQYKRRAEEGGVDPSLIIREFPVSETGAPGGKVVRGPDGRLRRVQ